MPQKTDAVIAELMDRRLLNDVDPDLHQEIAKAVVKAVHTASLQGEDAVERVARIINPDAFCSNPDPDEPAFWRKAARHLSREKARAVLATGLVAGEAALGTVYTDDTGRVWHPHSGFWCFKTAMSLEQAVRDNAAIRADEREKCAKVAKHVSDKWAEMGGSFSNITVEVIGDEIAAAIRSGGGE